MLNGTFFGLVTYATYELRVFKKVAKSLPLKKDYARAHRLYEACLRLGGEEEGYFRKKMGELEAMWKERGE